jgi:hypothetical protein
MRRFTNQANFYHAHAMCTPCSRTGNHIISFPLFLNSTGFEPTTARHHTPVPAVLCGVQRAARVPVARALVIDPGLADPRGAERSLERAVGRRVVLRARLVRDDRDVERLCGKPFRIELMLCYSLGKAAPLVYCFRHLNPPPLPAHESYWTYDGAKQPVLSTSY